MKSKISNELLNMEYEELDKIVDSYLEYSKTNSKEENVESEFAVEQIKEYIVAHVMREYGYVYFDGEWTKDKLKVESVDRYSELRKNWRSEHSGSINYSWRLALSEVERNIVNGWDTEYSEHLS